MIDPSVPPKANAEIPKKTNKKIINSKATITVKDMTNYSFDIPRSSKVILAFFSSKYLID